MYNTIIVPTDLSDDEVTIESLQNAETLSDNGQIILLHVLGDIPSYALKGIPTELMKELVPKTSDALKELVYLSHVNAKTEVRNGKPYRQIIAAVKDYEADLILINSHKRGVKDYLLGSTAEKVLRHAPSSVLVTR